ncbi:putative reverse transcriptase zinc-binding domain-containing protein [Rosa chinensis]|uniref:Putative reverse transcriptase zinc-binding domain-containing protein n=1 Tax=Rosa chinensis TaxID=74649 RepID=A0A2P6PIR2_ROSCH|nr:putative reverse transcriptase zinc-binding domain-containing protein [Rosa chinensis]
MFCRARIQPKVKSFIWRFARGIVPTKEALARRHVQLPNQVCAFCEGELETDLHLFKNCNVVACFWLYSTLGLKARNHQSSSLSGWILDMMEVLRAQQLDIFFMAAWTIWVERNNAVWNGSDFVPVHAASWSMNLHEYQMQSSDQFSVTQSID